MSIGEETVGGFLKSETENYIVLFHCLPFYSLYLISDGVRIEGNVDTTCNSSTSPRSQNQRMVQVIVTGHDVNNVSFMES